MNVLIVDDQPINLKLLRAQLEASGHTVLAATNGVEALEVLASHPVEAIISDILMPKMDGYRLCLEVRKHEKFRHLPFIVYTATYTSTADEKLCYDLGADKYLRKPAPVETILAALREVKPGASVSRLSPAPSDEGHVMQEYSAQLVFKLEEKNVELSDALERLKEGEQLLRLMIEHSPAAIAMLDRDMHYRVVSRRWVQDFRLSEQNVIGRSHYELFPDIPEHWKEIHRRCLAGAVDGRDEEPFHRADGTTEWIRWEIRPWRDAQNDIGGLMIFSEVITNRKLAEMALRSSEEHFRIMFERGADGMFLFSTDLTCRDVNSQFAQMMGSAREDLVGRNVTQFAVEQERTLVVPELGNVLAGRPYRKEWQLQRKNRSTVAVEISATELPGSLVLVTTRDITERRRAEEALRESERRFSDMMRNMQLVALMLDDKAKVMYCNEYLLRLTGWQRSEVLGKDWFELFIPPENTASLQVFADVLADLPSAWNHESEILTRSGERRMIRWNNTVLRAGGGKAIGTASIGEDITVRKQVEDDQQKRTEELERFHQLSVGRELQMIELKKEVNALARQAGQRPPYDLSFLEKP